jgi:hypothetical protein
VETLGASPFVWLEFDENGVISPAAVHGLSAMLNGGGVRNLVVISHGWKNDKNDAKKLYSTLWNNTCANFPADNAPQIAVAGVLWPAKAFSTDFDAGALRDATQNGALAVGEGGGVGDLSDEAFDKVLQDFASFLGEDAKETIAAAKAADKDFSDNNAFDLVSKGAKAVKADAPPADIELGQDGGPIANTLKDPPQAQYLLESLKTPPQLKVTPGIVKAQSLESVVEGLFDGPRAAIARFLNLLTYYEMKNRAGVVGVGLADNVLAKLTSPPEPIKLHLVGHSFGARLVTAAANHMKLAGNLEFFSLTLLQGAYSHNGLAKNLGAFPDVVGKPTGPIAITHTHNDVACTLFYALASRLSRDTTKDVGDAQDEFGAMGANGPQKLDPSDMEPDDAAQTFKPKRGKINTFLADAFIVKTDQTDAHNNITNSQCGRLLAATILS